MALALFAAGSFAGFAAAQIGVTEATPVDRGAATAVYFSAYYACGAIAGYFPGLIWQSAGWPGVVLVCGGVLAVATVVANATGQWARTLHSESLSR